MYNSIHIIVISIILLLLAGCLGIPEGITPVSGFHLDKYLGKWYEIARLDHSFERGLDRVTAEYSPRPDGGIRVINRGFSTEENEWKKAEGKVYFVREPHEGYLKVSFFGPFYGSYVIFELDTVSYQYAFVTSSKKTYLWFLSRTSSVSQELINRFVTRSKELGFNTENLIFVKHE